MKMMLKSLLIFWGLFSLFFKCFSYDDIKDYPRVPVTVSYSPSIDFGEEEINLSLSVFNSDSSIKNGILIRIDRGEPIIINCHKDTQNGFARRIIYSSSKIKNLNWIQLKLLKLNRDVQEGSQKAIKTQEDIELEETKKKFLPFWDEKMPFPKGMVIRNIVIHFNKIAIGQEISIQYNVFIKAFNSSARFMKKYPFGNVYYNFPDKEAKL